jgi:pimeloyl-ACP methyl ester carboxylesterase
VTTGHQVTFPRAIRAAAALLLMLTVTGCGPGGTEPSVRSSSSATTAPLPTRDEVAPEGDLDIVEGLFEVNGHELYVRCAGQGAPTVLYLHGWMGEQEANAVENGMWIEGYLHHDNRLCGYERRNTGRSEDVPGVQSPEEIVADITGVTKAVGEEGPFILLGASFGGMVAHAFAVTHPSQVAGIVLLDALFPDELGLDRFLAPEWTACSEVNQRLDARSIEKIVQCDLYRYCVARVDREPDVPLTYLASRLEPWARSGHATPEYAQRITGTQRRYVQRWSPGRFVWVDAPHFMEPAIPTQIAREITKLPTQS